MMGVMTGVRVTWLPGMDSDAVYQDIWRALPSETGLAFLVRIPAAKSATNWKAELGKYYFDDGSGTRDSQYQVYWISADDIMLGATEIFRPMDAQGAQILTRIPIDHDYGGEDALQAVAPGGAPISALTIYVYKKVDFDGGNKTLPVGITETDAQGRWKNPVYVEPGLDYVLVYEKTQAFGPTSLVLSVAPISVG